MLKLLPSKVVEKLRNDLPMGVHPFASEPSFAHLESVKSRSFINS